VTALARPLLKRLVDRLPVRLLRRSSIRHDEDGVITLHDASFAADPRFDAAYRAGEATGSWSGASIRWRAHVACWAASIGARLEGDFVECGVNRGGLARTVADFVGLASTGRRFWLLDTYEGLDASKLSVSERARASKWTYEPCHEAVQRTFADLPGARIVRGPVPDTLAQVDAQRVAYLSLDMNCAAPEVAAFQHFWPLMSPGAIVLLDDYGWAGHEEQRDAFNALSRELGFTILSLPTGQAVIARTA
jgi:O-methyltransferase